MGKFASRDSTGTPVAWGDITGKPSTFDPNPHDNAAHSTAYAPIASPSFTGAVTMAGTLALGGTGSAGTQTWANAANSLIGQITFDTGNNYLVFGAITADTDLQLKAGNTVAVHIDGTTRNVGFGFTSSLSKVAINGGLHVGGESDPGDNNLLVDGNATAGAFKTTNFTILQSGTDLLINYGATTILKISSAGYLRAANEIEPFAAL